ncbi:hypothetical protein STAS_13108 [Striga asiatica]|uniref:GTD-binding domain-containing protein n=1 Tax=Striga asiatica TaxID=4170 RepID=A0A5A7PW41_STRAF|nr:hypothetical protein STAS_13108 [Striga asiatica]
MGDEAEIWRLKHTLCAQQRLLEKLHNELDAEREASASAASEALSVILRLQREKAAVKLEGEQYKRLSEEKISHAQESLAIIEDIIHQKEMEIAALDCQVQAYRYKLLSIDFGVSGNVKFPECPSRENGIQIDSQMRKLDDRVKESECTINSCDFPQTIAADLYEVGIVDENSAKNGVGVDFHCPRVLDVFEVPHMGGIWENNEKNIEDKKWVNCEKELCEPSCLLLNGTSEIVKVEKPVECTANRDEELKLLKEIKESLNLLHEEIRVLKVKKESSKKDDPSSLCALSEAMLYFWL